ncbi:MAG TPA: metallophosphoesterase [Candidatus Binataceae bacterium]|nr:metallophosphoesterase [Candidatus Binataceae bacterium]
MDLSDRHDRTDTHASSEDQQTKSFMSSGRFALFLGIVLSIWAALHLFVLWRLESVPEVAAHLSRRALIVMATALWAAYPLARILDSWKLKALARPLEFVAATWIGMVFLLFATLLAADVFTLGGWLLPRLAPTIRGGAAIAAGVLSLIGLVQGLRPPVVHDHKVLLAGLPPERDGLTLVEISDLHLGTLTSRRWLTRLVKRVNHVRPDLLVIVGDVVDANTDRSETFRPILEGFHARLGVWAVTGNHEYYAGVERSVRFLEASGLTVLRDRWAEVASGLALAGVDDLTARRQLGVKDRPVEKALANRPPGATILLNHSPWQADVAAAAGAGLMLSGHTHNGQLWPFGHLVRLSYPLLGGRYEVGGMPVIVCRGTSTWGPPMRLWRRSEIIRVELKSD